MSDRCHLAVSLAGLLAGRVGLVFLLLVSAGCQSAAPRALSFAQGVAAAHGVEEWEVEQALRGELLVRFTTREVVDLRFVIEVDGERVRLVVGDGTPEGKTTVMVFDGERVWDSSAGRGVRDERLALRIWPTLIALPFQLGERGVRVEEMGRRELGAVAYDVARVTFARPVEGLGEWVMVYVEPETRLMKAVVYEPGMEPRAISFYGFEDVSGVKLATEWKVWRWTEGEGIQDRPVGEGRVFNLGFTTVGELRRNRSARDGR